MKIAITGNCGHVGTNITIEAISRGWKVVGMDNLHREQVIDNLRYLKKTYTEEQFEFVWGDVRNIDDFDRIPTVDAVIHLAANPGIPWSIEWPMYDFETNARGTLNALEFAKRQGNIPFIYASTNKTFSDIINVLPMVEQEKRYVWGSPDFEHGELISGLDLNDRGSIEAINERFPVSGFGKYGHSPYGVSKLTGELYCTEYHIQYGLPVVVNKMSCIFGLFQKGCPDQGWISSFLLDIEKNKPITFFGTGLQVRDVLDARDVARLYIDEVEELNNHFIDRSKCNGEIFTVGGGPTNTVSLIEAVEAIEGLTGKKATIEYQPKRSSDQDIYISSIRHVKEVMGWKPAIKFEQTLKDMWEEYNS